MNDIKIIRKEKNGELVSYNLTKKLAEVFTHKDKFIDVEQTPEEIFNKDLPMVRKLVEDKIREIKIEIQNNKILLSMMSKAKNKVKSGQGKLKLRKKTEELSYLISWLKTN